jgi:hypothetical protein
MGVFYGVKEVINENIKKKGPQDRALRHSRCYSERLGESIRHMDQRDPVVYVTAKPANVTIRKS